VGSKREKPDKTGDKAKLSSRVLAPNRLLDITWNYGSVRVAVFADCEREDVC